MSVTPRSAPDRSLPRRERQDRMVEAAAEKARAVTAALLAELEVA